MVRIHSLPPQIGFDGSAVSTDGDSMISFSNLQKFDYVDILSSLASEPIILPIRADTPYLVDFTAYASPFKVSRLSYDNLRRVLCRFVVLFSQDSLHNDKRPSR